MAKKSITLAKARKRPHMKSSWSCGDIDDDVLPVGLLLAGDNKHPLAVAIEALEQWRDADRRYAIGFVRAREGDGILRQIIGTTAMLAAAALRAARLADARLYPTLTEES